jgi:hypothetical protein
MAKAPTKDEETQADAKAADAKVIQAIRAAIEPLAHIQLLDRSQETVKGVIPGTYLIQRCGQRAEITNADIEAARRVRSEDVTLAEARRALSVLAKLPSDYMVKDPSRVLYQFPGRDSQPFAITNGDIETARKLC